jgi:hypothetical protein
MERHVSEAHAQKATAHRRKPGLVKLWVACKMQTFYAETQLIRYFAVAAAPESSHGINGVKDGNTRPGLRKGCAAEAGGRVNPEDDADVVTSRADAGDMAFFRALDEDAKAAEEDAKAGASVVEGFNSHRSAVVPWLRRTGIADHIRGLDKGEMQRSFAVPRKGEGPKVCAIENADATNVNPGA